MCSLRSTQATNEFHPHSTAKLTKNKPPSISNVKTVQMSSVSSLCQCEAYIALKLIFLIMFMVNNYVHEGGAKLLDARCLISYRSNNRQLDI